MNLSCRGRYQSLCRPAKHSSFALYPQPISFGFHVAETDPGVLGTSPLQRRTRVPSLEAPGSIYTEAGEPHGTSQSSLIL